ncbi:hypothetical protein LCGC14_1710240 [marine sediment metagenome]|uniref:Uncharacterized protein n=1 Tax=marine sediment metagenome TaxID=412755 RepID=A0A0F9HF30_9ZZZZ
MALFRVPGPCTVKFGSVSLGTSKQGVTIRTRTSWVPVLDDAHGTEPVDYIFAGRSAQVEVAGVDVAQLKTCNIFHDYAGLLGSGGAAGALATIGGLASALGKQLDIIERGAVYTWTALLSVPLDPDTLGFTSTTDLQIPITFLIVPDSNAKLFSTLPAYIL